MSTLGLAFRQGPGSGFYGWLIKKWTRSPYWHVEVVFINNGTAANSYTFSAYSADGGTRFKSQPLPSNMWDVIMFACTPAQYRAAVDFAKANNGLKYDWLGIFGLSTKTALDDSRGRFCSEVCCELLQHVFSWQLSVDPSLVSPGELHDLIVANPIREAA